MTSFTSRIRALVDLKSPICVGIDPRPHAIPRSVFPAGSSLESLSASDIARGYVRFSEAVIEEAHEFAGIVKPQAAFFEQLLDDGFEAFVEVCRIARSAGMLVIADVKRSDIGSTAEAYARAYLGPVDGKPPLADAVTVNPYLGRDGIEPFVRTAAAHGGGVFVLVKTSNPSSADYQDRVVDGRRLFEIVADDVQTIARGTAGHDGYGLVGAVVGATHPEDVARLRVRMKNAWFLVPGYGAQGAGARETAPAFDAEGAGAIVNASRTLNFPWGESSPAPHDWRALIRAATRKMRDELLRAREKP